MLRVIGGPLFLDSGDSNIIGTIDGTTFVDDVTVVTVFVGRITSVDVTEVLLVAVVEVVRSDPQLS